MKLTLKALALCCALGCAASGAAAPAVNPLIGATLAWTQTHQASAPSGFASEIVAFDPLSASLWVSGVHGVDVLNARTGVSLGFIDTRAFGSINSVAIHGGVAAFAIEAADRKQPGAVKLYDTMTRTPLAGVNSITVGSLPDMLTFSPDGSRLLVANEGTPNCCSPSDYGPEITSQTPPRNFGYADAAEQAAKDPVGSVSIIDMGSRSVVATAGFAGVPIVASNRGLNVRTNTGMDFEPEYIAVDASGERAYVGLQEANALAVLNLNTLSFERVVGLGAKDFNLTGNEIDPRDNDGVVTFANHAAKGLFMPDALATYRHAGQTYVVMANEGDLREDDEDRSAASSLGGSGALARLRISNTDSSPGDLYAAGARSFSIRDADGDEVYDSGSILDREAHARGLYDDGRSRDKGVEPEGVELMTIGGRTYAFIGLERTTQGAVAVFDISDPAEVAFLDMLVTGDRLRPEGLEGFVMDGWHYLAVSHEGSSAASAGTVLFAIASAVPEPGSAALVLAGLGLAGAFVRRRSGARQQLEQQLHA